MRHRTPQFGHIFAGDGYSAGYYSYLWSDTLDRRRVRGVHGGRRPVRQGGRRSGCATTSSRVGNTIDPADGYRAFRGRDAGIDALMRKRGFPAPGGAPAPAATPGAGTAGTK